MVEKPPLESNRICCNSTEQDSVTLELLERRISSAEKPSLGATSGCCNPMTEKPPLKPKSSSCNSSDQDSVIVKLLAYHLRRQAMSNNVLCCVEAFLVAARVVLVTLLGLRVRPKCPNFNAKVSKHPCQDQLGSNMEPLGGIFGGCDGFGGVVESQRGATLHIHLMAYIIIAFQHHSLREIGDLIRKKLLSVAAIAYYLEWASRRENLDQEIHDNAVDDLEQHVNMIHLYRQRLNSVTRITQ